MSEFIFIGYVNDMFTTTEIIISGILINISHIQFVLFVNLNFRSHTHARFLKLHAATQVVGNLNIGVWRKRTVANVVISHEARAKTRIVVGGTHFHIGFLVFRNIASQIHTILIYKRTHRIGTGELITLAKRKSKATDGKFSRQIEIPTVFTPPIRFLDIIAFVFFFRIFVSVIVFFYPRVIFRLFALALIVIEKIIRSCNRKICRRFLFYSEPYIPTIHAFQIVLAAKSAVKGKAEHSDLFSGSQSCPNAEIRSFGRKEN